MESYLLVLEQQKKVLLTEHKFLRHHHIFTSKQEVTFHSAGFLKMYGVMNLH